MDAANESEKICKMKRPVLTEYIADLTTTHQWSSCVLGVLFLIVLARKNVSSKKFPTDRGIYALDQKIPSCSRNIYSRSKNPRLIEEYMLSSKNPRLLETKMIAQIFWKS